MGCNSSKNDAASEPKQKVEVVAASVKGADKNTLLSAPASADKKKEVSVSSDWSSEAEPEALRIFKLVDKDGDGYIDMAELAQLRNSGHSAEVVMATQDTNKDGKLSLSESLEFIKKVHDNSAEVVMATQDTNKDGKLSLPEWLEYIKKVHDKKPASCKAMLKFYEKQIASWERTSIEAERIFNLADKDGNGYIDMAELANLENSDHFAEVMMSAADTNKDGRLSLSEWLEYIKSIHDKKPAACKALLKSYEKHIASWEWKIEAERISKAMEESVHRLFCSLDKDGDGKVVASEFLEFVRATTGSTRVTLKQAQKDMAFKDANKDGALDEKELAAMIACDGVDAATITAWCESLEKSAALKQLYFSLDKNHDGKVVASKFLEFLRVTTGRTSATLLKAEKSIAFKDKNKDGALDEMSQKELALACDGVDAATITEWCESLANRNTNPTKSAWMGWFCSHSHTTSVDEVCVGN